MDYSNKITRTEETTSHVLESMHNRTRRSVRQSRIEETASNELESMYNRTIIVVLKGTIPLDDDKSTHGHQYGENRSRVSTLEQMMHHNNRSTKTEA